MNEKSSSSSQEKGSSDKSEFNETNKNLIEINKQLLETNEQLKIQNKKLQDFIDIAAARLGKREIDGIDDALGVQQLLRFVRAEFSPVGRKGTGVLEIGREQGNHADAVAFQTMRQYFGKAGLTMLHCIERLVRARTGAAGFRALRDHVDDVTGTGCLQQR